MAEAPILAKIRKLLKLAADLSNAHEAALAAERAQALLFKHHLSMADVTAEADALADVAEIDRPPIEALWRKTLAAILCHYNFCKLLEWKGGVKFIGKKAEVETVLYLYIYLSRAIFRLAREGWAQRVIDFTDPILGRYPSLDEPGAEAQWKESFCIGAVEMIGVRLKRQRDQQAPHRPEPGLMRVRTTLQVWDGLLTRYVEDRYGPVEKAEDAEASVNMDGFRSGVKTGKVLPLSRGLKGDV